MSFSQTDRGTLGEILDVPQSTLIYHLNSVIPAITAEVETLIKADIALWPTYRNDFVTITDKEKNFGARVDPGNNRLAIKTRVANWLDFDLGDSSSEFSVQIYRG